MKILASGMDEGLEGIYDEFADTFGIGPCGAYAALRREQGWGQVASCLAGMPNDKNPFPHYVIVGSGIIDGSNPLGYRLEYSEIDILGKDEMPDLIDETEVAWLRERMN